MTTSETPEEKSVRLAQEFNQTLGSYKIINPKAGTIKALKDEWWAKFFRAMRENQLVYLPDEKSWYDYNPSKGIFVPTFKASLQLELAERIRFCSETWADPATGVPYDPELADFNNAKNIGGAMTLLEGLVGDPEFFQATDYLVHLADCTLRFGAGGELLEVEDPKEEHRTKKRAPFKYNPEARCPKFLEKILSHLPEDSRILIQKYAGQCLLGRNLTQRFLCLIGVGRAGKGALVEVISGLVGLENIRELRTTELNGRFELGFFKDASLLVGADVPGDFMVGPGAKRIKSLTGGDSLTVEIKNGRTPSIMKGTFNIILNSNEEQLVNPAGDRRSWEGRILHVPYDRPFEGPRIPGLSRILLDEEGSGILNWALNGLSDLLNDVREIGDFYRSPEQIQLVDDILAANDWFRLFIKNEIVADERGSLTTEEIISRFSQGSISIHRSVPPERELQRRLPQLMENQYSAKPSENIARGANRRRGYRGVSWKDL